MTLYLNLTQVFLKRYQLRFNPAVSLVITFLLLSFSVFAQSPVKTESWIDALKLNGGLPEKLLSTRTVVFYSYTLSAKELKDIQESFQRTGIDAVAYFELDMLMSGKDITRSFATYLTKREVVNLGLVEKRDNAFRLTLTTFNGKENVVDAQQNAWSVSNSNLTEALKELYRTASNQQKRHNLLINDVPETGLSVNPILGKRNEFFAIDVKVDPLAVPKFGDEALDSELEALMQANYPLKYKLTEPGVAEKDLRKQGFLYVICIVHTRGAVAKELLGYDMSKSESALVSVTYPGNQQELKNFTSNTPVYKIYFKHIDSGNVFLGTKWDADLTWQQALLNHIRGLKAELRIN